MPTVTISARGEERVRGGHPWIYRADVVEAQASAGDVVRVIAPRGKTVGHALYSDRSQIAIRFLTRGEAAPPADLWRTRIEAAVAYRRGLAIDADACRLVHGEADLLPALIVDRYADYLVVQTLSQAVDRRLPELCDILVSLLQPRGILARNDPRVRELEGLDRRVDLLYGEVPDSVVVREGPVEYEVDLWHGQKTGLFLDQRENRTAAAIYAHGRLLDGFSYHGGFALRLADRCPQALAIDSSEEAVRQIARNAARNGLGHVHARAANVFDELRALERERERFGTIVLDPPAFAKNRAAVPRALAGYKEINLRALRLLAPGGILVTCTCSYHVSEAAFGELVYEAACDAHAQVTIIEKRMQARDHPVLLGVPESYYLKCLILRKLN
jgi:23S rRNA (cytosine1962-C5)-methyltransferase